MSPRIRIFLVTLVVTLLGVEASASASPMASVFASPSACVADPGNNTLSGNDTIAPSSAWQIGSPAGTVNIPLTGTGVDNWEWKIDCAGPVLSGTSGNITITGDGTHILSHRAQETGGGPWTPWVDDTVKIDSNLPDNQTAPPTGWRRGPLNVNVTGADATSSPLTYEWRVGTSGPWTAGNLATVNTTGTHTLMTAVIDAAGNRAERSDTVKVDNANPTDNTSTPTPWQHAAVDVTVTGSDADSGIARVDWELDGVAGTGVDGSVVHIGTHGTHTLKTRVVDNVGNDSGWVTRIVRVDINGPVDTTTVPAGWVTTPTVNVSVSGTDSGGSGVTRIEWDLDNGTTSGDVAGAGPVPVTVSGDGVHTLKTRLTDGLGDVTGWNTYTIRIDTVTPTDTTSVSSGWLPLTNIDVTLQGTDAHSGIGRVEWKLDGVADGFTGTTKVVNVAGNGEHVLETRVIDVAGNASAWVPRTIRLDSTAPDNLTPTIGTTGWRTTSYSVVLNGSDSALGRAPRRVDRRQRRAALGAPCRSRRRRSAATACTSCALASATSRATAPASAPRTSRSTASSRPTPPSTPPASCRAAARCRSPAPTPTPASPAPSGSSTAATSRPRWRRRSSAPTAPTRSRPACRTTPATGATGDGHLQHRRDPAARGHRRPDRHHVGPVQLAHRPDHDHGHGRRQRRHRARLRRVAL